MTVKQRGVTTGEDRGVLWIAGGMLRFRGIHSVFDVRPEDFEVESKNSQSVLLHFHLPEHEYTVEVAEKSIRVEPQLPRWRGLLKLINQLGEEDAEVTLEPSRLPPTTVQKNLVRAERAARFGQVAIYLFFCVGMLLTKANPSFWPVAIVFGILLIAATFMTQRERKNLRKLGDELGWS